MEGCGLMDGVCAGVGLSDKEIEERVTRLVKEDV